MPKKVWVVWLLVFLFSFALWFIGNEARPSDRCQQYVQTVRVNHFRYFGINFPYHYGVGQLKQESSCRADITSFDAGKGIAQFMPKTKKYCEQYIGEFNPMNPYQAIRAQAWYMSTIHKMNKCCGLWMTYTFYNSGQGTVLKEYKRAGYREDWHLMKAVCSRGRVYLKSGQVLDFCKVGYDYPIKVYRYGKEYQIVNDAQRYW